MLGILDFLFSETFKQDVSHPISSSASAYIQSLKAHSFLTDFQSALTFSIRGHH